MASTSYFKLLKGSLKCINMATVTIKENSHAHGGDLWCSLNIGNIAKLNKIDHQIFQL